MWWANKQEGSRCPSVGSGSTVVLVIAVSVVVVQWAQGACGDSVTPEGGTEGMSYCQDMAGTFHFQAFVPPWKYRREYECTDGNFKECHHWEPTGRYVYVVTDIPYISYDSEIIDLLRVEFVGRENSLRAATDLVAQIRADDQAAIIPQWQGDEYEAVTTTTGLSGYEVFWTQVREHDGSSFEWHRRDVFLDAVGGLFHLEMFSIDALDRPDFDALVRSFAEGPAPDEGAHCPCMDELADPPIPCVRAQGTN